MPSRRSRPTRALLLLLAALALVRTVVTVRAGPPIDLLVYRQGAADLLAGESIYRDTGGLPFTYPPFAALLALPLTWLPEGAIAAASVAGQLAAYGLFVIGAARLLGTPPKHLPPWLLIGLLLAPVQRHVGLGQVNLALAALVVIDATIMPARLRGWLTGVAAGIKIVPAVFVFWHLARGDRAAAARAVSGGLATAALGLLVTPSDTWRYFGALLWDPHRVGGVSYPDNLSITGIFARALATNHPPRGITLAGSAAGLGLAVVVMRRRLLRGDDGGALVALAVGALLASPVSWSHHWVWVLPAAMYAVARGHHATATWWVGVTLVEPLWLAAAARPWPWLELPWPWPVLGQLGCAAIPLTALALLAQEAVGRPPELPRTAVLDKDPLVVGSRG